jgi:hypothetical protein
MVNRVSKVKTHKRNGRVVKGHTRTKNDKIARVMREYKSGTLKSSSGQKVSNRKQAIAIALSEARRAKK